jgi:pimeloyl-ACP methyl ester carboxylesterase
MTRTGLGRRITSRLCGVRVARRWTNPVPPLELAPQLCVPVAYVHGTDDRFIPLRDAAQLWEASPEPRRLAVVRGMGHAFEAAAVEPIRDAVTWALARELSAAS